MLHLLERLKSALADRYTVESEIGRGGMAFVYLAKDVRHAREVAIKVLRPELAQSLAGERFLREIQIVARLNHPHVLPLYDSGEADSFVYYVMPYVEGESLRSRLQREKQLPIDDALTIAHEVADAISHAHTHGIVHRDLKPGNILLSSGHAVVADFGIARALSAAGGDRLTTTGLTVGTPAYMSPEQAMGDEEVGPRSDIYSLGCVLYEMLIGSPPFTGATPQAILARKSVETAPTMRSVRETIPAVLEQVVRKALARVPADRFRSGPEFISALDRAKKGDPEDGRRRVLLWPQRLALRVAAVAAIIVALGATAFLVPSTVKGVLGSRAAAVQPARSVAVLPFVNQTGDPENEYLSDGVTDELIGRLGKVPNLERVISRASVHTYKGRTVDPRTVAEDLNVGVVVTGAMARRDTNWALSVEVIDARDDGRLWGDTFELTLAELQAVSDRLAREIARAMNLELSEERLTPAGRSTHDPEAYRLYLRGLHLANQYTSNSITEAIEYFERALDLDPGYALPYSAMAQIYGFSALFGLEEPSSFYPKARRSAQRALVLDGQLAEAHSAMALVHLVFEWDWARAEREYGLALQLDPHNAFVLSDFAAFLSMMDRHDEAIAMIEQARDLDPVSAVMNHQVAWAYQVAGQHERAVEEFERVLELFPNYGPAHMVLAWSLVKLGRQTEAVASAERAEQLSERDPWVLATMGYVYARAGEEQRARDNLAQLTSMAAERRVDPQFMAIIHSGLGDTERALEWLERAYEARSPNLAFKSDGRLWFPDLVTDPRYQALRAQMNFPPD